MHSPFVAFLIEASSWSSASSRARFSFLPGGSNRQGLILTTGSKALPLFSSSIEASKSERSDPEFELLPLAQLFAMSTLLVATSFPGSLFSASLSRWNREPACGWSRDHLAKTAGWVVTQVHLVERKTLLVVTWPAATRVPNPTTKGGREKRPWERGCACCTHV